MWRGGAWLVALQACRFEPGVLGTPSDSDGGVIDQAMKDGAGDVTLPAGAAVRMLDVVDAKVTAGPHANFVVLVSLSESWLATVGNGGSVAHAQGFDIHFSADQAGTALAHEVESYVDTGTLVAWVRVPSLTAATTIYLHYGDPTINASTATPAAVWSGGFAGVWHFGPVLVESTGGSTTTAAFETTSVAGKVGASRNFDGGDDYLDFGSATAIDDLFANSSTIEGWLRPSGFGEASFGRLIDKGGFDGWAVFVNNASSSAQFSFLHGTTGTATEHHRWDTGASTIALNQWQHFAITYDRSSSASPVVYLGGSSVGIAEAVGSVGTNDSDAAATAIIGNRVGQDRTFAGDLDELRFSSSPRDAGWIQTSWANQDDPGAFVTVSGEL